MPGGAAALVDLERYPVDDLSSPVTHELAARCRAELDATGVSILPEFLTRDATAALLAESDTLAPIGHHSDIMGTPYLELPADTWPEGHPRVTWGHNSLDAVAYDLFPDDSVLRALYEWDVLDFFALALGIDAVYRYDDPLGGLNLAVMRDGDDLFWHFDQTDFVVSLAIQESDEGGDFELAPFIRGFDDEHYDDVAALLAGDRSKVMTTPMRPGTLMLFEGRRTLHRVTPVRGSKPRYVGLFGYDRKPGTRSSDLLKQVRYGRTG